MPDTDGSNSRQKRVVFFDLVPFLHSCAPAVIYSIKFCKTCFLKKYFCTLYMFNINKCTNTSFIYITYGTYMLIYYISKSITSFLPYFQTNSLTNIDYLHVYLMLHRISNTSHTDLFNFLLCRIPSPRCIICC